METTIQDFADEDGFDLAWLPSFFIPESALDDAVRRIHELLRQEGRVVVPVTLADESDGLAAATDDLMAVRSGGSVIDTGSAVGLLERAGFDDVHEIERTWKPPLRFVVGTRPCPAGAGLPEAIANVRGRARGHSPAT